MRLCFKCENVRKRPIGLRGAFQDDQRSAIDRVQTLLGIAPPLQFRIVRVAGLITDVFQDVQIPFQLADQPHLVTVLQVLADSGQVGVARNVEMLEHFPIADPRQHQQLGRVERPQLRITSRKAKYSIRSPFVFSSL